MYLNLSSFDAGKLNRHLGPYGCFFTVINYSEIWEVVMYNLEHFWHMNVSRMLEN